MRHIRLLVEYDGTGLCGWQRQANGPTVQGHLEAALAQLLTHEVSVIGASRTDAGVHARGQVASFRTERAIPLHGIRRGLNALLPPAIAIVDASEAPDDFHPRFSATGKHYRYLVLTRADRSPRWRDRAWHHPAALDRDAMREAAAAVIGEHDFAAFRAAGCTATRTVRRIDRIDIRDLPGDVPGAMPGDVPGAIPAAMPGDVPGAMPGDVLGDVPGAMPGDVGHRLGEPPALLAFDAGRRLGEPPALLAFDVVGNAFLRNMVRIVVGTLVEVGEGRRPAAQVAEILASKDRTRAGITAPAGGLELVSVRYDGRKMMAPPGVE